MNVRVNGSELEDKGSVCTLGRSQMSVDASFQFFEQVLSEYESNRYILNWQSAYISPFKGVSNTKLFFFQYFEKYFFPILSNTLRT